MLINRYLIVFMLLFIFASCEDKESSSKKSLNLPQKNGLSSENRIQFSTTGTVFSKLEKQS